VPRPYLLAVSNFDRRKNLPTLVAAWRRLREKASRTRSSSSAIRRARRSRRRGRGDDGGRLITPAT